MNLQQYEELREKKQFEPLWLDLLNASGFAGVLPSGGLVDRRYYPDAIPVSQNSVFGVAKPKAIKPEPEPEVFEITFDNHLKIEIEVRADRLKVNKGVNGWGEPLDLRKVFVNKKQ